MKIAFCDELGAPELGIVMEVDWYDAVRHELGQWLQDRDSRVYSGMVLMNQEVKMEFMLTWA